MSKIIKKQIKRSMPWFLILCLFSSLVMGAAFNYNIEFKDLKSFRSFDLTSPEAKADTATTSVVVRNAAPSFSSAPYEAVSSTSTTPVNAGASIAFRGTGSDPEMANYYLLVCSTNSATSTNGGAPACVGGVQYCVSGATANLTEASCTYSPVSAGIGEIANWYAFVCDSHSSDAACNSVGSQGANPGIGVSSSPFYINHGPNFTIATTTIDYVVPGGQFTVSASSSDPDVARGAADVIRMDVCSSNVWSTTTGCAATTICTATSTADPSCSATTSVPMVDQAYQYWVFIKDAFDLGSPANSRTSYYHVINVAPVIGNITINGGSDVILNIKGAANKAVVATSTITDNNTCSDLTSVATGTMYISDAVGANLCTADNNTCYQITAANCSVTGCVGAIANVTCTTTLAFHARPTNAIADNPYAALKWLFAIRAFDESTSGVATTSFASGVEVMSSIALDVTETNLNYGNVRSSFNTDTTNATSTIVNYGNTPMDTNIQVEDMASTSGAQKIYCENQKYASSTFDYDLAGVPGSSTTPAAAGLNIPKPTSAANVQAPLYWGIGIPSYIPSGNYTGFNTFSAIIKASGGTW